MTDEPTESWIEKQERMKKADRPTYILVIVMFFGLLALVGVISRLGFGNFGGIIVALLSLPLFFLVNVWWTWDDNANKREAGRVREKERKERIGKGQLPPPPDRSALDNWYATNVTLEPGDLERYGEGAPDTQGEDDTVETGETDRGNGHHRPDS